MINMPQEWKDAVVVIMRRNKRNDPDGPLLGIQAHWQLDDVFQNGASSEYWEDVKAAVLEFMGPVWDALRPSITAVCNAVGPAMSGRAYSVIAGVDEEPSLDDS